MRKTILGLGLTFLLAAPCGAAETIQPQQPIFTDITDNRLLQTASVLNALGIMEGTGQGIFSPDTALTRAQFCKIAVTSMGCTDVSAYRKFTIFPDVKSTHWASQYINAAIHNSELKEQAVIRGYADGTFRPDQKVNYGEACTMLLRILGYKESDIGPFWPTDYIAKAQSIGLTEGITIDNPSREVSRRDAAIMILNTLITTKQGEQTESLLSKIASQTIDNYILLETSDTSSDLQPGEARFYEESSQSANSYKVIQLEKNMIGMCGTLLTGKNDQAVISIVPDNTKIEKFIIKSVNKKQIETDIHALRPKADTPLYLHTTGKVEPFSESWKQLRSGNQLTRYYNKNNKVIFMAVLPDTSDEIDEIDEIDDIMIYGVTPSVNLPEDYQIIKNGTEVDSSQLQKYDVITVNDATKKIYVSDVKLTGYYTKKMSSNYPKKITMYGVDYDVTEKAAAQFADIKRNQRITLLFNAQGKVASFLPAEQITEPIQGELEKTDDGKTNFLLDNGLMMQNISAQEHCILLETGDTNGQLAKGAALFFEDGKLGEKRSTTPFDKSMIGAAGTLVVEAEDNKSIIGLMTEDIQTETYTIQNVFADRIETTTRTLYPERDTPLYIHNSKTIDELADFSQAWVNLSRGDTLTLYYNKYGRLILMAVLPEDTEDKGDYTTVYGIVSSVRIPDGYQIIKNGAEIDRSKLKKYDVVTVHHAEKKILVSDKRISGRYLEAEPSFSHPKEVTLYGIKYNIPDDVANQFSTLKWKDSITLLFDAEGKVAAVYPREEVSAAMEGIVIEMDTYPGIETPKGTATVLLTNGLLLRNMQVDASTIEGTIGYLVYINQNEKGKTVFYKRELYSEKVFDDWQVSTHRLGNKTVSSTVALFEQAAEYAPLVSILQKDLPSDTISKSNIKYTLLDSSGSVVCMVLEDVTDKPWQYGIASGKHIKSKDEGEADTFAIMFTYWDGSETVSKEYPTNGLPIPLYGNPVMIPKNYSEHKRNDDPVAQALIQIDTVDRTAFDGKTGVHTKDGYYDLRFDDMQVYITDRKEYISLRKAKADYTSFTLYADKKAEDGGKICVIVAP